jgi:tetratricopeptide (TPR) repeat protein
MELVSVTAAILLPLVWFIPPSLPATVEKGDAEFAVFRYAAAEVFYEEDLAAYADSADILWRLARVNVCIADIADQDRRLELYRRAESFADRCIRADSTRSEGHTWRAAALGNIAMFEGSKTKVKLCHAIKAELEESIRLNPRDDIAYSVLGSFYMALGNVNWVERRLAALFLGSLPEGGYDDAESALKKAVALSPRVIRHHAELGDLYELEDRPQEALTEFQLVLTLPVLLASDRKAQDAAARSVQKLTAQ